MSYGTVQAEKMTTESGYSLGAGNASSFKNRFINPGMVFSQRGTTFTNTPSGEVTLDRMNYRATSTSYQNTIAQSSSSPPTGFTNFLLWTATSSTSLASTDRVAIGQIIEANNMSDLSWGTANAKAVTLSFWVRCSVTGTLGGAVQNATENYCYPFSYTVNAANTWEFKTVAITGPTAGTWATAENAGAKIYFSLGAGSSLESAAGTWVAAERWSATGTVDLVPTSGNTFAITGIQFEVGTVATSFDFRSYGTELALCQRYYEKSYNQGTAPGTASTGSSFRTSIQATSQYASINGIFAVPKRTNPSTQSYQPNTGTAGQMAADSTTITSVSITSTQLGLVIYCNNQSTSVNQFLSAHWTANAEY